MPPHSPFDPPGDEILVDATVLAERRARRAELGEDALRARAADAERAAVSLERRLTDAEQRLAETRRERDHLATRVAAADRALTVARQQAFADEQARIEAEDALAAARRERGAVLDEVREELLAAGQRVAELERELAELRAALAEQESGAQAEILLLQHELDRRLRVEEVLRGRFSAAVAELAQTVEGLGHAARAPVRVPVISAPPKPERPEPTAVPVALISDLDRAAERLRAQAPAGPPPAAEDAPAADAHPRRTVLRRLARRLRKQRP